MSVLAHRLFDPPRSTSWCPGRNCRRPCGPGTCICPPCRCDTCRARTAKARSAQLPPDLMTMFTPRQQRLFPGGHLS